MPNQYQSHINELRQSLDSLSPDAAVERNIDHVLAMMDGSNNPMQDDEIVLLRATEYGLISKEKANQIIALTFKSSTVATAAD